MLRFRILLLIFMVCSWFPLFGVDATYTPEPTIYLNYLKNAPEPLFTHPSVFGAKLGRLSITSDEPMYNPTILVTGIDSSYNIVLIGAHRWSEQNEWEYDKKINMNLLAVSYPNGLGGGVFIRAIKDKQPLLQGWSGEVVTTSPFIVDFYLVNMNDHGGTTSTGIAANLNTSGGYFKLDSSYVFKDLFNPGFTVGITDTKNQGPYVFPTTGNPTQGQFIPINNNVGQGTTSVINPGGYSYKEGVNSGFFYGDGTEIPEPVNFLFSFVDQSVSFNLNDAYGNKRKIINTAQMEVLNGVSDEKYAQNLTFTVEGTANSFKLIPVDGEGLGIDFTLYFGETLAPYGMPVTWSDLSPGLNTQTLRIGEISESQVIQRASGNYHATIIVNISPVN